jgi:hypothetical protein
MAVLVAAETVLLVLLVLLVVGLLRSHAEILRRVGPPEEDAAAPGPALDVVAAGPPPPEAAPERGEAPAARDVAGTTLRGDAVQVGLAGDAPATLLAFLSSGCTACQAFWSAFAGGEDLPGQVRLVVVTEDGSRESPSRLRRLAPPEIPVVLSSAAWADYAVPASPYFVLTAGGRVRGEGSAEAWPQLASLVADALEDEALGGGAGRARRAETALSAAGIAPGHPSLDPDRVAPGADHPTLTSQEAP